MIFIGSANNDQFPAVVLYVSPETGKETIAAVLEGLEEQSVPWQVRSAEGEAVKLAHRAARESILRVGLGLGTDGGIALHQAQLDRDRPLYLLKSAQIREARLIGENAGRLVKGLPMADLGGGLDSGIPGARDLEKTVAEIIRRILGDRKA